MALSIIKKAVETLKSGDFIELEKVFLLIMEDSNSYFTELDLNKKLREQLEKNYYTRLNRYLELGREEQTISYMMRQLENFKRLLDFSDKLDIFIDIDRIPERFEFLSRIHLNGIRSGQIGEIFEVIRFFNDIGLLEREFSKEDLKFIANIKKNKLIIANLHDLFEKVSNGLIYYTYKSMIDNIFKIFLNFFYSSEFSGENMEFFYNKEDLIEFIDNYPFYGLRVKNLGSVETFLNYFQESKLNLKIRKFDKDRKLFEFDFRNRKHVVSITNLEKNLEKISEKKDQYHFYNLSMVVLGGLGPQGHGFTYSTPRGKVCEICSDRKETDAIVVKYKEFLKRQFLVKLRLEMTRKHIITKEITRIMDFLSEVLKPDELINYFKKDLIVKRITQFLDELKDHSDFQEAKLQDLIDKIEKAIIIILRPIDLIDQFRCRMELIEEGKLKSEDIAKLTSLKDKSHYDVLRERFFFQNQIEWFFRLYSDEIAKYRKQRENLKK